MFRIRSLENAPISDFSVEIFPHFVGEKDITAIAYDIRSEIIDYIDNYGNYVVYISNYLY